MAGTAPIHVLRFVGEVTAPIVLGEHKGSALRGALFGSLWRQFCLNPTAPTCQGCPHLTSCPVAFLLVTTDPSSERGQDVPRPYVIEPPPGPGRAWRAGEPFEFRLVTFGRALSLLPYVLLGVEDAGEGGFGAGIRRDLQWWDRRPGGRFALQEVWALDPLGGRQEQVFDGRTRQVRPPDLPVEWGHIEEAATRWGAVQEVRLRLTSPLRLVDRGRLVHPGQLQFRTLFERLADRRRALSRFATDEPLPTEGASPDADPGARASRPPPTRLSPGAEVQKVAAAVEESQARPRAEVLDPARAQAQAIAVEESTRWADVFRYSGRHRRGIPIGGLVGEVRLRGNLTPFLPLLLWGELAHVGKDAVLGNGAYVVERMA